MQSENNTKRVTKNTIALYLRMLISMGINLYSSRIILENLGVEDFGIYNIVGGIISLMAFVNSAMSGSTSRFITFDIGKRQISQLTQTISSAIQIHLVLAFVFLLIGETVGLWLVNNYILIPESKIFIANVVYQLSLLSAILTIAQVPQTATIIAYEEIDIYAVIEILYVVLRLLSAFLLVFLPSDKLIYFSLFILISTYLKFLILHCYVKYKHKEFKFLKKVHKEIIYPMLGFASWDLYGNACVLARDQGSNILINKFFGVVLNAAAGIAAQVGSAITTFVGSIVTAVRPQIIKTYAVEDWKGFQHYISFATVLCIILLDCIIVPLYIDLETVMKIWLNDVPLYSVEFCRCILFANGIIAINYIFSAAIQATGNIKYLSIITGTLFLVPLFVSYFYFKNGYQPVVLYKIWLVGTLFIIVANLMLMKIQIKQFKIISFLKYLLPTCLAILFSSILSIHMSSYISPSLLRIILIAIGNFVILLCCIYIFWIVPCYRGSIKQFVSGILK